MPCSCDVVLPAILGSLAFLLSLTGTFWCQTFQLDILIPGVTENFQTGLVSYRSFSLVVQEDEEYPSVVLQQECLVYDNIEESLDSKWNTAIVTKVIGWWLALAMILSLFFASCCGCRTWFYRSVGLMFSIVVVILDSIFFIAMSSEALCSTDQNPALQMYDTISLPNGFPIFDTFSSNECKLGRGAYISIVAPIVYFITGIWCYLMGQTMSNEEAPTDTKEVVQDEVMPEAQTGAPAEDQAYDTEDKEVTNAEIYNN